MQIQNSGVASPAQNNPNNVTGSFNSRKVQSSNISNKLDTQNINSAKKFNKPLQNFKVNAHKVKDTIISLINPKSVSIRDKKAGVKALMNIGYRNGEAKTIVSSLVKTTRSKAAGFFSLLNDQPTKQQNQQKYISRFQFNNDLDKAVNDVKQLGYTGDQQIKKRLTEAQNISGDRNSFLEYVENMPNVFDAGKGYTSKIDVSTDIEWGAQILAEIGYSKEDATNIAETLQADSLSRNSFLEHVENMPNAFDANKGYTSKFDVYDDIEWGAQMFTGIGYSKEDATNIAETLQADSLNHDSFVEEVNIINYTHKLQSWAESILEFKGYEKAEATAIFANLLGSTPDFDIISELISSFPTKEEASSGSGVDNTSAEEKVKLKQEAFEILELKQDATLKEISKAYKELALKYHPDKNPSTEANSMFQKINQAYELLAKTKT